VTSTQDSPPSEFDIAIVGGGLVGLSLARALEGSGLEVALVDRMAPDLAEVQADAFDVRVYAISPGSEAFLRGCGSWPVDDGSRAALVVKMKVFGDASNSRIGFSAYEAHVPHLATIVENRLLMQALWRRVQTQVGVTVFATARGTSVTWDRDVAHLVLDDGRRLRAKLMVAADGADSWLRGQAGITAQTVAYGQTAIVANFACEQPHHGTAFQWFTHDGVLAMLPLPGNRTSMVWSIDHSSAQNLMSMAPAQLCAHVVEVTGAACGALELISPPAAFPLRLIKVKRMVAHRIALVGDAAHNVHPLAGQGVNLGFQDARELAKVLRERGACRDIGEHRLLRRYERARREDVLAMTLVTDGLQRLFASDRGSLSWLRNRGLGLVERAAPLKNLLVRRALG